MRIIPLLLFGLLSLVASSQNYYLFIGTYTNTGSKGIYVYRFNASTGKAAWVSNTEGVVNPSYLAIAPTGKYVYAVTETAKENAGSVSAFEFNAVSGRLKYINKHVTGGDNPCYVAIHKNNKWLLTGNYSGGSLAAFRINQDGSLLPFSQLIQHTGKGPNAQRQEKSHVHATVFSPDYKYLFAPDLGLDKVMIYAFKDAEQKPLTPAEPAFAASEPGSGPRHFTFSPHKKYAYLIEELSGTVVVYGYKKGKLNRIQREATHPEDYKGKIGSADIHISPDGKFLYASNRGEENTITIFSIDKKTGKITLVGYQPTLGKVPRNFIIDPTGKYLLVAHQNTNNIVIFKRDIKTGLLQFTGDELKIPAPVCLQMLETNK